MRPTRRRFLLTTAGAAGAAATAGCLGARSLGTGPAADGDGPTAQASFLVVSDLASQIADGTATVHNLVPFGQHGHGWEPGPAVQRDIVGSDAFVYVGQGFQPWADRVVRTIREDGVDVAVVEAWADVELLDADGSDEEAEHDGHDGHDGQRATDDHDEHGYGATDPHYWLDPERARLSVETIARGFGDLDEANEATYTENSEAVAARLTALDDAFRERLSGRTRDTVLVAGHNSFRYLGRRYGFEVEALIGLSPDAAPTPRDVSRAQAVIEEHDVEHVLAPVFESDRAARQLVEETDAVGTLPLTPVPSLTPAWREKGWGYVEVMEHVNLPSVATALGAE